MEGKISVIIPCYNVEQYISECIESVLTQSAHLEEIEIIAVDDKSTDKTYEILKEYEQKYPDNIILIPLEEHVGLPGLIRNIALSYATGDYIIFLDSDDVLEQDFAQTMVDCAISQDAEIVSCGYQMFADDCILSEDRLEEHNYNLRDDNSIRKLICNEGTRTSVWARIYKKDFLLANNIRFPETYHIAEDMYFWHSCIFKAKKIVSISDSLYKYRVKSDSIFHNVKNNYAYDLINCIEELSSIFTSNESIRRFRDEYGAVLFLKCGYELLGYLDAHETSDEMFDDIIGRLRNMLRIYWRDLPNNKYLDEKSIDLAKKLIG